LSLLVEHPIDYEPGQVGRHTYVTRRRRGRLSIALVLSVYVVLLYVLPAHLIVPNLTYAGRPALLIALGLFSWWLLARLNPRLLLVGPQPLRWVTLAYLASLLLSYVAGIMRGLPTLEANAQNFTVLITLEFFGVVLMVADGLPNLARLNTVLRMLVWSAVFMALVGIIQSTFKFDIAALIQLPGLQFKAAVAGFQNRGDPGLFRVAGTATHFIEFSTVLAMAVPFAIHYARFAPSRRLRVAFTIAALVICAAIPMAISRTGIVALVAGVGVMFMMAWDWRVRYNILCITVVLMGALSVLKPGLLGTLRYLFGAGSADDSLTGRTDDYELVGRWFSERPILGRGPGTLVPDLYIWLDNQWLLTLVTFGLLGVATLLALHVVSIWQAGLARRRSERPEDKHLAAALVASQVVGILVGLTFDSLSFSTYTFTLALLCGCCGALWRFTHPARTIRTSVVSGQIM